MSTLTDEEAAILRQYEGNVDDLLAEPTVTPAPVEPPKVEPPKVEASAEPPKEEPASEPAPAPAEPPAEPAPAEEELAPDRLALLPTPDLSRAQEQLDAIKNEKAKLEQQFDDGEIDAKTFRSKTDDLNDAKTALLVSIKQAEFASTANASSVEVTWMSLVDGYRSSNAELRDPKSELAKQWDREVKMLGALPENGNKPMEWFLKEGHRRAKLMVPGAAQPKGPTAADRQSAPPPKQSLADVPSAVPADANGADEFAQIDALEGEAKERAFARLTPEQRMRYLTA